MKSNLPLILIGGGVLFFLLGKKPSGTLNKNKEIIPDENPNEKPDEKITPVLKGITITCSTLKISNKKVLRDSLQEIATYLTKKSVTDEDAIFIIFDFVAPKCFDQYKKGDLSNQERRSTALLLSLIVQNYATAIIPRLEKEGIDWDKYLTKKVYPLQTKFLEDLGIPLNEYNDLSKQFDITSQFPIPKQP